MKIKYWIISTLILLSLGNEVRSQTHFIPVYGSSAPDYMNFVLYEAKVDGINLVAGDEIGIFDGGICVGVASLSEDLGIMFDYKYFVAKAGADDSETGEADGYSIGNSISYKMWDTSAGEEIVNVTPTYYDGWPLYEISALDFQNGGIARVRLLAYTDENQIKLQTNVMLEGPLDGSAMDTDIHDLIPLTQPYSGEPWNYSGTEVVGAVPAGVVDWLLIELREATEPALATSGTIISKRAAFLKSDGNVVDLNGAAPVTFTGSVTPGMNLYVVIRHRNHLAIMSATEAVLNGDVYEYDFTTSLSQAYGGGSGYKQVGSIFVMVAGDLDYDGGVFINDYSVWKNKFGEIDTYGSSDLDMDGSTYASDYTIWKINFGSSSISILKSTTIQSRYICSVPK